MKYDYDYTIVFKLNEPFDIDRIKNECKRHPNSKILVEVQNTKGISSSMIAQLDKNVLIRVAGGYDLDRINRFKIDFPRLENYYYDAVIYTKNETVKMLEVIEKIESGLNENWSDMQKLLYIYDRLKAEIMYDPKYKKKASSEIRSLRGLITKQTVCAGYSMIFKEFMDRNDISCEYVEGFSMVDSLGRGLSGHGHAWNIVNIDGKKYPIDLTWDNSSFRAGKLTSFEWLGKNVSNFCKSHYPKSSEKTQDYEHTLSQIDPTLIRQLYISTGIGRSRDYSSTTYRMKRNDGSWFMLAQIGDAKINNANYCRYYYINVSKDGKSERPLILYSETNINNLINCIRFGKTFPKGYDEVIKNILFSEENISDSLAKKTYYIGNVKKDSNKNKFELISSYEEISKPEEKRNLFTYPTRHIRRSDGSIFIAQKMFDFNVKGISIMSYDIFEIVSEAGKTFLKKNTVFTEKDFFKYLDQNIIDTYLSRERLDRKSKETGGYIGYYDKNNMRIYNSNLAEYFKTSKQIDIDLLKKKNKKTTDVKVPSFSELKSLALKYEIYSDSDNFFDDISKFKIRDIKTGQIISDKSIIYKALFANIWLTAAGMKVYDNDSRPGEKYAFNSSAEELYNVICKELLSSCENKGVIDTVSLLNNITNLNNYKHNKEIIVNLFKTEYQTEFINKLFLKSLGFSQQTKKPETLHSLGYVNDFMFSGSK